MGLEDGWVPRPRRWGAGIIAGLRIVFRREFSSERPLHDRAASDPLSFLSWQESLEEGKVYIQPGEAARNLRGGCPGPAANVCEWHCPFTEGREARPPVLGFGETPAGLVTCRRNEGVVKGTSIRHGPSHTLTMRLAPDRDPTLQSLEGSV